MTVLNYSLQQNYTSTDGHKFSWLSSTYTPLSGNIFIKHGLQRSLEAVCWISQGPRVLHKQLTQSKTDPAQRRGVLAEPPFQLQLQQQLSSWSSHQLRASICQASSMSPPICLPPRQQQGNVSALPNAPHHTLRRFPETCCGTLKGVCRCINVNTGVLHWMVEVLALVAISWTEHAPQGSDVNVLYENGCDSSSCIGIWY